MTMTPEEKLATALQLAEKVVSAANIVSHDGYYELDIDAVTVVLSEAIERMQERVRAETERCEGIVAARMKTLAALEGSFASQRFMEAEMILAAIRETPHAEG